MKKQTKSKKATAKKKVNDHNGKKKFKIEECINKLTLSQYKAMGKEIPALIGKCINTFVNYKNIPLGSKTDIPYHNALKIERYFGLNAGTLSNEKIDYKGYNESGETNNKPD